MRLFRLIKIIFIFYRYGLFQIMQDYKKITWLFVILRLLFIWVPIKNRDKSIPIRLRIAFEQLGPVFVKLGQLLSTRPDILTEEYVIELSKLQNQVPAFAGKVAKSIIERSLKRKIEDIFNNFTIDAVASASIAQVHKAVIKETGDIVAIKVLRPNIKNTITNDIKLMQLIAWFVEKLHTDGKRLRPLEIVDEFKKTIFLELDFHQEAANATELGRLHKNDANIIIIPKVYFDYCTDEVLVLEWMDGIPISNLDKLVEKGVDLEKLSHSGVTIFYTQVFNYGFFHADMHPGNILCDENGRYIGLDFGIVGCLSEDDKRYLAINILAFFNRDYKKVAITHIESGWAPKNTSVEELENAIRSVCEPIFNKPLSQISFGQVLVKLFQISRRFDIVVQPQLILLQKTIINVEGLGRVLNPNLDLWQTAKPILEKWMKQQMGIRGFLNNIKNELPYLSYTLPKLPRRYYNTLISNEEVREQNDKLFKLIKGYKRQNFVLTLLFICTLLYLFYNRI
jgi:ubiquinone biosynthesis protein